MKNPNGYGTIYKLSGNRRRPWIVRVPDGKDLKKQKLKYKTLGYFATRTEAMIALADYNKSPYDIDAENITFAELYEKWSAEKFSDISVSNVGGYKKSFADSAALHNMKMADIRFEHLDGIMADCDLNHPMRLRLRLLWRQLFGYAMERDIVQKDYSAFVKVGKNERTGSIHKPFTDAEIKILFDNLNLNDLVDTILIMVYTGLRVGELLDILSENVHLNERYMRGGLKTEAGIDRVIPLNKKIIPFVKRWLDKGTKYLIQPDKGKTTYYAYKKLGWDIIMSRLGFDHLPHDCRHTFATKADEVGMNKLSIKMIMGHASQDITEKVYTHRRIQELVDAVDLLKFGDN